MYTGWRALIDCTIKIGVADRVEGKKEIDTFTSFHIVTSASQHSCMIILILYAYPQNDCGACSDSAV